MPAPLTSTNPLKSRLLSGASAAVIVLALGVVAPTGAVAQTTEIIGGTATATPIPTGDNIISGTTGGQFGVIDVSGANDAFGTITFTADDTLRIFGANTATATSMAVSTGTTAAIVFGTDGAGGSAAASNMTISGNLEGPAGRGGDLSISAFNEAAAGGSAFQVDGSTMLGQLTIAAGSGLTNAGQNMVGNFGDGGDDAFDVTGLTINAGNAVGGLTGGNANVGISADEGGPNIVTVGTGGITLQAGHGDSALGGNVELVVSDSATVAGAISVISGNDGAGGSDGGTARLDFEFDNPTSTVTVNGAITIATGADTVAAGVPGNAEMRIGVTTFNANGGVVLSEQRAIATATLTLDGASFAQMFNGTVTAQNDGDGVIVVDNGVGGVIFANDIGSSTASIGTVTLNDGDLIEFDGNVFANSITTAAIIGEVQFDGDVTVGGIDATTNDGALLDFNGDVSVGSGDISIGTGDATFAGNTAGIGSIIVDTGSDATFDGTTAQTVDTEITTATLGAGGVLIGNTSTDGVVFNSTIGATGGAAVGDIVLTGGAVTFNDRVFANSFSMAEGTRLVINDAGPINTAMVTLSADEGLIIHNGTIHLGSEVGANDTVFDLLTDAGADLNITGTIDGGTVVTLSANFREGTLVLIDDDSALNGTVATNTALGTGDVGQFNVTDTALTDFVLGLDGGGEDLTITANARSTAEAAATLGVSTGEADALRQAVTSATNAPDTAGLDALTTALNAGGMQATQAAQQVGPQGSTLGGGAQTGFDISGQQQGITGNRLAGFRSDDPRFVSAFAAPQNGETGFAGGDLDGPYSAPAPRYAGSAWFQGFGGYADTDGDTLIAGYDANYGGAMIGIDGAVSDNVTVGAFGSYTFSSVDGDGPGNAQLDANTYTIGVYAGYTGASFYLDGFASYAGSDNDVTRTALAQTITGNYDATQFAVGAAMGVPIEVSSNVFITPNASLTYNHYEADSYTETGSAGFSAIVNPGSASQLTGTLGARIHAVYEQGNGTSFIPELRVGIIGDLVDDDAVSTATFVGGGTAFNVTGTDTDDIGALIGVGLAMDNAGWSAGISYDADIRSDYMSHTARAEFRWKF